MSTKITISAPTFDMDGTISLMALPSSDIDGIRRRANRVATLDGGAVFNDAGHSAADRTFRIRWLVRSADEYRAVQRMLRLHAFVYVATPEGLFYAKPESCDLSNGEGSIDLLVQEQMTQ